MKACVVRYGAFGDAIMISQIFKKLENKGYHVTANLSKDCMTVLRHNPYIDNFILQDKKGTPYDELVKQWDKMKPDYDLFINLSGTIEETLLKAESQEEFYWPKAKRHEECNKNYYDYSMEKAGFDDKGLNGILHFTKREHKHAEKFMRKYKDKFVILWSLSGSSAHKSYPYAEIVAMDFLESHHDVVIITVGDTICRFLEWEHARTLNKADRMTLRQAMCLTKYVDLVIGSETGILNASGCYDTPKIVFLSHSSHENLTKNWENVTSLNADVPCHPCHQLHFDPKSCPTGEYAPLCMEELKPQKVLNAIEEVYRRKKSEKSYLNISNIAV